MRADDLIATMDSFVGITEIPPGSNRTPIGAEFGWNGVPWCAETVSVACTRNGFPLHEAAVINIEQRAKQGFHGMFWSTVPVRGSAVCYDFGGHGNPANMHTGIVYEILGSGQFRTIEGNYRDRVDRWLRDMKFVRGFAVFPFDSPMPQPPPQPPPEDDMVKVHLWKGDVDTADGAIHAATVYVVREDLTEAIAAPNEQWLADAAYQLGERVLPPLPGGTVVDVNGVKVEQVGSEFLRPIVT